MQSLNKLLNETNLFKESMSDNKKKAMIIGTYHLFLDDGTGESMLGDVRDRMVNFVKKAPTEVRFELNLGHPGVAVNLVDAWLHAEVRKATKTSKGLDTNMDELLVNLQSIMGGLQNATAEAASAIGVSPEYLSMMQNQMYTDDVINGILDAVNSQEFTEIDQTLQTFKKIQTAAKMAMDSQNKKYDDSLLGAELIKEYDGLIDKVNKVIIARDRKWVFPTSDRVLICVGYEHIKFVKDVYREKGYTIIK